MEIYQNGGASARRSRIRLRIYDQKIYQGGAYLLVSR